MNSKHTSSRETVARLAHLPPSYRADILRPIREMAAKFPRENTEAAARFRTWYRASANPPAYSIFRAGRELGYTMIFEPLRGGRFAPQILDLAGHAAIAAWIALQIERLGGMEATLSALPEITEYNLACGDKPRWSSFVLICIACRARLAWRKDDRPALQKQAPAAAAAQPKHRHMTRSRYAHD